MAERRYAKTVGSSEQNHIGYYQSYYHPAVRAESKKQESLQQVRLEKVLSAEKVKNKPNLGHHKRLRDRFIKSGLDGFHDYEVLELLLTYVFPNRDTKLIAKDLLAKFKKLGGVIHKTSLFGKY